MTIKQFLEKQPLDSDTILRFQFTDRYDVGWNHNTAKSSLKDRLIENFSCDLQRDEGEPGLYIFNLNLNKIPKNLFTTLKQLANFLTINKREIPRLKPWDYAKKMVS